MRKKLCKIWQHGVLDICYNECLKESNSYAVAKWLYLLDQQDLNISNAFKHHT